MIGFSTAVSCCAALHLSYFEIWYKQIRKINHLTLAKKNAVYYGSIRSKRLFWERKVKIRSRVFFSSPLFYKVNTIERDVSGESAKCVRYSLLTIAPHRAHSFLVYKRIRQMRLYAKLECVRCGTSAGRLVANAVTARMCCRVFNWVVS